MRFWRILLLVIAFMPFIFWEIIFDFSTLLGILACISGVIFVFLVEYGFLDKWLGDR